MNDYNWINIFDWNISELHKILSGQNNKSWEFEESPTHELSVDEVVEDYKNMFNSKTFLILAKGKEGLGDFYINCSVHGEKEVSVYTQGKIKAASTNFGCGKEIRTKILEQEINTLTTDGKKIIRKVWTHEDLLKILSHSISLHELVNIIKKEKKVYWSYENIKEISPYDGKVKVWYWTENDKESDLLFIDIN